MILILSLAKLKKEGETSSETFPKEKKKMPE